MTNLPTKRRRGGDAVEEEEEPRSSSGPACRRRTRSAATARISRARCGGAQGSPGRGAEERRDLLLPWRTVLGGQAPCGRALLGRIASRKCGAVIAKIDGTARCALMRRTS